MASAQPVTAGFRDIFNALKPVLAKYEKRLYVKTDKPDCYYLETKSRSYQGERMFFGSIRTNKEHVSLYLMPVYSYPELLKGVPAGLRKRLQGKSCFTFTTVDRDAIGQLRDLVAAGFKKFGDEKLL
jgi:hypothetical protein